MNTRTKNAQKMTKKPDYASQLDWHLFKVKSQSKPGKNYQVSRTGNGLICTCEDHTKNKFDCKHIGVVLDIMKANKCYKSNTFRMMSRKHLMICKYCDSGNIKKWGMNKTNQGDKQTYKCGECDRRFTANIGFEKMRSKDHIITRALNEYFSGSSVRDVANGLEQDGIKVSHMAVYHWVRKYSRLVNIFVKGVIPRLGKWFRADEVWIRVAGNIVYLFASMDDDTRFWIAAEMANSKHNHDACNLLDMTKKQAGKIPSVFISDKLSGYSKASKKVFGNKTYHKSDAGIRSKRKGVRGERLTVKYHPSNNKMERLNGEVRDREKVFRGLKKMDTEIIEGMWVHYNFVKKHSGINNKTPAAEAKIEVEGPNIWKTLIENAALSKIRG